MKTFFAITISALALAGCASTPQSRVIDLTSPTVAPVKKQATKETNSTDFTISTK